MNVLITGGSGLIGQRLTQMLQQKAYQVAWLSRGKVRAEGIKSFSWDPTKKFIDIKAIEWADYIIHLAGAGVADKPWTKARKKEILDSRVDSTELLYEKLRESQKKPLAFISASAIGYYGFTDAKDLLTEESNPGNDFLAEVVKHWETRSKKISTLSIRTVIIRVGIVLSAKGGALKAMAAPVKWGFGAALGSGSQQIAWIHMDDLCRMFIYVMEESGLNGVYNAVGPNPVTNKEFTKLIAKTLKRPYFLPNVPSIIMKLMLGEMAGMVLNGSAVSNQKIAEAGFTYQFQTAEEALADLLKKD